MLGDAHEALAAHLLLKFRVLAVAPTLLRRIQRLALSALTPETNNIILTIGYPMITRVQYVRST